MHRYGAKIAQSVEIIDFLTNFHKFLYKNVRTLVLYFAFLYGMMYSVFKTTEESGALTMNQDVLFSQYLEELTDTITNLDHFNIQKTYDILKQLCIAFRVCKGVAEYYNNAEEERLEKARDLFEADGVFPPRMIDGILKSLRSFHDRRLLAEAMSDKDRLRVLVNKYFYCG